MMDQDMAPWMANDLAIHGTAHYVTNVPVEFSSSYWNANLSMSKLAKSSIENIIMQAHRKMNFQLLLSDATSC